MALEKCAGSDTASDTSADTVYPTSGHCKHIDGGQQGTHGPGGVAAPARSTQTETPDVQPSDEEGEGWPPEATRLLWLHRALPSATLDKVTYSVVTRNMRQIGDPVNTKSPKAICNHIGVALVQ